MRTLLIATVLLLGACSSGDLGTDPGGDAVPPPAELTQNTFEGTASCAVGLVKVEVKLLDDQPTLFYPGSLLVRVSIDGRIHRVGGPNRIRVDGREAGFEQFRTATSIEVYAGLGGDCEWITAQRIG